MSEVQTHLVFRSFFKTATFQETEGVQQLSTHRLEVQNR